MATNKIVSAGQNSVRQPGALSRSSIIIGGIKLMDRVERISAVGIVALLMVSGFLESVVIAVVVPLVYVVVDPSRFNTSRTGQLVTRYIGHPVDQIFLVMAIGLIVLLLLSAGATWAASYFAERHNARCRNRLSRLLIGRFIEAPYIWIIKYNSVVMARHLSDDVKVWRRDFLQSILMTVQSMIMIISPAVMVVVMAPAAGTLALLFVGVVCAAVVFMFRRKIRSLAVLSIALNDIFYKSLMQILTGVREVKVSGHAQYFLDLFERNNYKLNKLVIASRLWGSAPANIINILGQLGFIATAVLLWSTGSTGVEFAAQMALIAVVVSRVVPAFNRLAVHVAMIFRSAPTVENLLNFIAEVEQAISGSGGSRASHIPANWQRIKLDNVSFTYPGGRQGVAHVSIELERGKSYGFVGRSGAGKTTLVNLLLGLIDPTNGAIYVDQQPLTDVERGNWHRRFGYVPQDSFLLDGTLRENILFGSAEGDESQLTTAIQSAQLTSLIDDLPKGVDTTVGERGRGLSGGQAQRVAIARAIFRKPEILFFDEATSALDSMTEFEIYNAIERLRGGCLTLTIAHRVTTLRNCDRIFVLNDNRIIDSGTFDELIKHSEIFRGLAVQAEESAPAELTAVPAS